MSEGIQVGNWLDHIEVARVGLILGNLDFGHSASQAEHHHADAEHHPLRARPRDPQSVMVRVVDHPQPHQEECEAGDENGAASQRRASLHAQPRIETAGDERQRGAQPQREAGEREQ